MKESLPGREYGLPDYDTPLSTFILHFWSRVYLGVGVASRSGLRNLHIGRAEISKLLETGLDWIFSCLAE